MYADEPLLIAGMISTIVSLSLIPLASVPLFLMQYNSPALLCYYLNERDVAGFWNHSLFYWILVGLDGLWLYIVLTYIAFLVIIVGHVGCGILLMLKTLK